MDEQTSPSRRGLLKASAAVCAMPLMVGAANAQQATASSSGNNEMNLPNITKHRTLGSGDFRMEVSALGFGVMGMNYNRGPHPDRKAMIALLHQAVDRGVTLFDTAQVYGPLLNEELAGEGLHAFRNRVSVTTKFGHRIVNGKYFEGELDSTPQNIRRVAEESLKRLRIETIELFYQHRLDPAVPIEDVAGAVKDLIREGKVKRFGLCEVNAQTIRRAHAVQPVTAVQSEYHLMWRGQEREVFPVLQELGIGFVPYSPLGRGFLTGELKSIADLAPDDYRRSSPRFQPGNFERNLELVQHLHALAARRGCLPAQLALAWVLHQGDDLVPIPGTKRVRYLEQNAAAVDITLTADELAEIDRIVPRGAASGDRYHPVMMKLLNR